MLISTIGADSVAPEELVAVTARTTQQRASATASMAATQPAPRVVTSNLALAVGFSSALTAAHLRHLSSLSDVTLTCCQVRCRGARSLVGDPMQC